jgi:Phage tail protein (Tail_P2_I)
VRPRTVAHAVGPIPAPLEGADPPFDLGDTGRDLYAATEPVAFADPENAWAWAHYMAALSLALDVVSTMVRDDAEGNPGWTALASPARCPEPWLRVLAQWAGVRRWDAISPDDLRALIGPRAPGLWRGTQSAIREAVRRFIPENADILFDERTGGDPYAIRVFTFDYYEHDPEQVRSAIEAALPAGLTLIYEVRSGQTYGMVRARHETYADVRAAYDTYADMRDARPIPGEQSEEE